MSPRSGVVREDDEAFETFGLDENPDDVLELGKGLEQRVGVSLSIDRSLVRPESANVVISTVAYSE